MTVEFLNSAGQPAISQAQRRNCITSPPWQAGTEVELSVTVENFGSQCECQVEFFLANGSNPYVPLNPLYCNPTNPLPPTGLNTGDKFTFSMQYVVQSGDVGSDTLYAQIQTGNPPYPNPTDMTQICNALKTLAVLPAVQLEVIVESVRVVAGE